MYKHSFYIANSILTFQAEEEIMAHIGYLLRNHNQPFTPNEKDNIIVTIICDELPRDSFDIRKESSSEYYCTIASNFKENRPQWFYYLVLIKIILRVLSSLDYVSVHGTLVYSEKMGLLLFIGNSGGGKSTLAASWLNQGYPIMSDDMIFIDKNGDCYPLLRDLHIESSIVDKFPNLTYLPNCEPYMPGYTKLGYDWVKYHPELILRKTSLPDYVIESNISDRNTSYVNHISAFNEKKSLLSNLNEHSKLNNLSDVLLNLMLKKQYVKIYWSNDIWAYTNRHYGFIYDNLLPHL